MKKINKTKELIKKTADKLFTEKGFHATSIRDIAKEADINPALLNYHFKTKDNLYNEIINEKLEIFMGLTSNIMTQDNLTIEEYIKKTVTSYQDILLNNADLPIYIINEIRKNRNTHLLNKIKAFISEIKLKEILVDKFRISKPNQFILEATGILFTPYIFGEILKGSDLLTQKELKEIVTLQEESLLKLVEKYQKKD